MNVGTTFFRLVTMHMFDRLTDRKAFGILCSCTVKTRKNGRRVLSPPHL